MTQMNAGWYFYRKSYERLRTVRTIEQIKAQSFSEESSALVNMTLDNPPTESFVANHRFDLSVCYPGLLIGSGYQHESGAEHEFKIGFFFDYSTGLPQVPGSSVKGTLRSFFPGREKGELKQAKYSYIVEKLIQVTKGKPLATVPGLEDIERLEKEIFEGLDYSKDGESLLSIYRRDRFFDAILSPENSAHRRFLGTDFITPHKDPLGDPLPLMFLKVLPQMIFRFRFELTDSRAIPGLDKSIKLALFKSIILDAGIGAKTNVGYGQFDVVSKVNKPVSAPPPPPPPEEKPILPKHQPGKSSVPENTIHPDLGDCWNPDNKYLVEIHSINNDYFTVKFKPENQTKEALLHKNRYKQGKVEFTDFAEQLKVGQLVKLRINKAYNRTEPLNFTILVE